MKIPELKKGCVSLVPRAGAVFGLGEALSPVAGGVVTGLAIAGSKVVSPESDISLEQLPVAAAGMYVLAKTTAFATAAVVVHKNEEKAMQLIEFAREKRKLIRPALVLVPFGPSHLLNEIKRPSGPVILADILKACVLALPVANPEVGASEQMRWTAIALYAVLTAFGAGVTAWRYRNS